MSEQEKRENHNILRVCFSKQKVPSQHATTKTTSHFACYQPSLLNSDPFFERREECGVGKQSEKFVQIASKHSSLIK